MLSKETIDKLNKPLDRDRIKHRQGGGGMQLAYIPGHDAIDRANALFGFGSWGYDILNVELVSVPGEDGSVVGGYYAARVRLTVQDCVPITEEGVCPIQSGRNPRAIIDAHDMARKGAVTDAMKRALRCFGDQFGNSLYDTDLVDGQPGTEKTPAHNNQNQQQQRPVQPAAPRPTPNYNSKPNPAPTAAPAQAPTKPKENPLDSLYYKHYSQEFARCKTVKDLEQTVEVMRLEVQDEDILALLRKEYGAAQKRLKELSAAAANELEMAFSEGR